MESARAVERMMSEIKFKRVSGNDDLPLPS
ncbi:MAG TPA: dUTP diphosphatase, partial [Sulfitobacter sp.]|nr:dUTP diphosphatase [Sulfitobacter sp.]